jgi:hypothetical protein
MAIMPGMRHLELLPAFAAAFALCLTRLRWLALTKLRCRSCSETHLECGCKPVWVRLFL